MRSRRQGTVVRVVSATSLVLGTMGGAIVVGPGGASARSSAPLFAPHQPFHPVQADQAFARLRGKGYAQALGAARQRAATLPRAATGVGSSSAAWAALGPKPEFSTTFSYGGPNSGRITGLALGSTGSIYAASAGGGVWSSTNDGTSWTTTTDTQPNIAMGAVAVDPTNPQYIFAGTGEDNSCLDCLFGSGITESTDGGSTWTTSNPSGMFSGVVVSSIAVVPGATPTSPPAQVLVGTSSDLFVSTDAGSTWTAESGTGWSGGNVTSIVLNPLTTPDLTVYAFVAGVGLEESTDGGTTWSTSGSFAAATNGALAIAPNASASSTTLYLSLGSIDGYLGMSKSINGGATWTTLSTVPFFTGQDYAYNGLSTGDSGDQSWYDNAIAIDPTNPNIVVAGGITAVVTTDGGGTWTNLNGGGYFSGGVNKFHPDFHAVVFNSAGDLYLGNDGGVWKLPAAHVNPPTLAFTNLNGNLNITQFYAGLAQSGNATQILAGAQDNGSDRYTAASGTPTTWNEVDGGDGGFSAIDPANPQIQYSEADISVGGSLDRTQNGWANLSSFGYTPSTPPFPHANWAPPLVTVPGTAAANGGTFSTVLIGGDVVYKSTDGAASWAPLGAATSNAGTGPFSDVSAIAVAPSHSSVIYAGFDDGTVQMSSDGGATWTILSGVPTSGFGVTHVSVSASDPFTIYVSFATTNNGFPHQSSDPSVLVGTALNTAPAWTDVSSNLPTGVPTNSVISDGANGLIVANDTGVFSAPILNGASTIWSRIGTGLPDVQVMDVVLTPQGTLIATTHGRGAWSFPFFIPTDGIGTMMVSPTSAVASSTGKTLTFTYTASGGGLSSGEIDVAMPAGWSASSITTSAPGYTTSTCGSVAAPGSAINVTAVTLTSGATCTITYGSKASSGPGAIAPSGAGASLFATTEKSTSSGTLTPLAVSPNVTVTAAPPFFTLRPGPATDIASGGSAIWALGTAAVGGGHPIFHWTGSSWSLVGGGAVTIAVGPDGIPWALNSTHHIFHRSGTSWTAYPGLATDIAVGANGSVWIIGAGAVPGGYGIFHWTGSTWSLVGGGAVTIAVGPDGIPWALNSTHHIFHRSGISWTTYPGLATDIAVGANGSVWIIGAGAVPGGFGIFHWTSSGWAQVPGGAVTIAVTPSGNPWIITSTHAVYSH